MKKIRSWGGLRVLLVVAYVERVRDDAADQLRRETRELWEERRGEGVEVGALV